MNDQYRNRGFWSGLQFMMESLCNKYVKILEGTYKSVQDIPEYSVKRDTVLLAKYKDSFLEDVSKVNGRLKVVMDREFAEAIIIKIRDINKNYRSDFPSFEKHIQFLTAFSNVVAKERFIHKRDKQRIDALLKEIKNSPVYRFTSRLALLMGSQNREVFRQDFFETAKLEADVEDDDECKKSYSEFYKYAMEHLDRKLLVKLDQLILKFEDSRQILDEELRERIDEYLKQDVGFDDEEIEINHYLRQLAVEESLEANEEFRDKIEEKYEYLKRVLQKFSGMQFFTEKLKMKLVLAKFGSNVSGFASKNTDMDLTILTDCYVDERSLLTMLHRFLEVELKEKFGEDGKFYHLKPLLQARIPLIKLFFLGQQEFQFDIIVNNILGVINSKFLSIYGSIPWIRNLGMLVKLWAKNNDMIEETKFSSYSMNILMLHFLIETRKINLIMEAQHRDPKTAPHFTYSRTSNKGELQTFDVYYQFKTDPAQVTSLKRVSLYQLLLDFFHYYKEDGQHWKNSEVDRIISVDGSKKKEHEPEFIFTIRDPFDEMHNPGRVKIEQFRNVMNKFQNAWDVLNSKSLGSIRDLLVR